MDLTLFKLDIDELIKEFEEGDFKSLSDMKRVWLARKFSYIFDAKPGGSNMGCFMQSLYDHCVGHIVATYSLSHRLGGLYCLYYFYEVQPFKPPFKIYLSLGEVRRLKALVNNAKKEGSRIVSSLIRKMLDRNSFEFGLVSMDDFSAAQMLKINKHNAMLRKMHEKLFPDHSLEKLLYMDMGMELNLGELQKVSADYAEAKALLLKEAGELIDMEDIKHIVDNGPSFGDELVETVEKWNVQKDAFRQEIGSKSGNLLQENEYAGQMSPSQQLAVESQLEDDSFPRDGFMQLSTAGDEEEVASQEIDVEEIERLLGMEENQEEDSGYADDLEKQLSETASGDSF